MKHSCQDHTQNHILIEYLKMFKKFSPGAELQPIRASPTMSFPQMCRFFRSGSMRRVGVWPWVAYGHGTMYSVYSAKRCFENKLPILALTWHRSLQIVFHQRQKSILWKLCCLEKQKYIKKNVEDPTTSELKVCCVCVQVTAGKPTSERERSPHPRVLRLRGGRGPGLPR